MSVQHSPDPTNSAFQRFDPLSDLPRNDLQNSVAPQTTSVKTAAKVAVAKVVASDAARARQLLDRAFELWEKGDASGAVMACRQSLALEPRSAGAYSMLGLLLERNGDVAGAIAAYDKAVEIEPSSLLERDSARRLRALSFNDSAPTFDFEEDELFGALAAPSAVPSATSSTRSPAATTAPNLSPIADKTEPVAPFEIYSVPIQRASAERASAERASAERASAEENSDDSPAPFFAPSSFPSSTSRNATPADWFEKWRQSRSFWLRSLPLCAVAGMGFLFLLWSRGVAVERDRAVDASALNQNAVNAPLNANSNATTNIGVATIAPSIVTTPVASPTPLTSSTGNGANANGTANSAVNAAQIPTTGGLVVDNNPQKTAATSAALGGTGTERRLAAPRDESDRRESERRRARNARSSRDDGSARSGGETSSTDVRSTDARSVRDVAPSFRPIPPADVSSLQRSNDSSTQITEETGQLPSFDSAPPSDRGARPSSASGPLPDFPAPSQVQRVAPRTQNEVRPNDARPDNARSATPQGSSASAQNTAFSYQTRAMFFVDQGDNTRAARDFQNAITLYRRQIARGEQVNESQRGLELCRKGLSLISVS